MKNEMIDGYARKVTEAEIEKPINYVKAMLPPLPIIMLILLQPRFHLFPAVLELYPEGQRGFPP